MVAQLKKMDSLPQTDVTKAMLAEADALFEEGKYSNIYEKYKNYKVIMKTKNSNNFIGSSQI